MNPTSLIVIGVLAAIWVLIKVAPRLLVRRVAQVALEKVGESALGQVPVEIHLSRANSLRWKDEASMLQRSSPLVRAGFNDIGTFSIDVMPGVLLQMLFQPQTYVSAHLYEHPKIGSWIEFATRYTDDSSDYLTTLPDQGITPPPFARTVRASKDTSTDQLYQQHLKQRKSSGIKPVSPNDAIAEFEHGYRCYMIWKNNTGLSAQEVAQAAMKWAKAKQQAAGKS
jgi:hypothetical protein